MSQQEYIDPSVYLQGAKQYSDLIISQLISSDFESAENSDFKFTLDKFGNLFLAFDKDNSNYSLLKINNDHSVVWTVFTR